MFDAKRNHVREALSTCDKSTKPIDHRVAYHRERELHLIEFQ